MECGFGERATLIAYLFVLFEIFHYHVHGLLKNRFIKGKHEIRKHNTRRHMLNDQVKQ